MKHLLSFLFAAYTFLPSIKAADTLVTAFSPDRKIKTDLLMQNDSLYYQVSHNAVLLIKPSRLGIKITGADFLKTFTFESANQTEINESYTLPSGKKSLYTNHCREITATFKKNNTALNLIFRLYNDGFAFRYHIPATIGNISLHGETSEVNIRTFNRSWVQKYHKDYSWYYESRDWNSNAAERELNTPALVKSGDTYLLITEALNDGRYAASKLIAGAETGNYSFLPVGTVTGNNLFQTPWRAVILGDIHRIVESTLIENLNPETEIADLSWIKPGRTSWDWGGEDARNSVGLDIAKRYIDLAHRMGWEYFTLDDGWQNAPYSLGEVVDYANTQSVGLILWAHQNWFQNDRRQMFNLLKSWKDAGIKGVKADFWEDDSQAMMQKYDLFLSVTAELQLLVDLHGCTKPSGLRRTWPHLLTSEAVLGGEFYIQDNPEMVHAAHNINLLMTRNVIGPMDYTPADFGRKTGRIQHTTSWSHQLALTVACESGIQFLIDCPENYRHHISESFLKRLPVAWDDIRCLEAQPETAATIARRKGRDWYVASLCNQAKTIEPDLSFLDPNTRYYAYIYKDGNCMSEILFDYIPNLTGESHISIPLLKSGGATIHLSVDPNLPKPDVRKYEAESGTTLGTKPSDPDGLCSGGKYVANIGFNNVLKFSDILVPEEGDYAMTLYYMCNEPRTAYIKINNEQSPIDCDFVQSGGTTGNYLACKTIVVSLKAGKNTIELGNKQAFCPCFDRITLKAVNDPDGTTAIPKTLPKDKTKCYLQDNRLHIPSTCEGNYSIFDIRGRKIESKQLQCGENTCYIPPGGIYIVNITGNKESYSHKINTFKIE